MKNTLKILIAIVITVTGTIYNVNGQTALINSLINQEIFFSPSIMADSAKNNELSGVVYKRALKDFQKNFGNVNNATWYEGKNGGYIAKFVNADVRTIVAYNPRGSWGYTIHYYGENKLPGDVRKIVRSTYYDYAIIGIAEVHFDEETVYMIYLQDESHFKTVRVYNDEMEEVEIFSR